MTVIVSVLCVFIIFHHSSTSITVEDKLVPQTKTWSDRLGAELWHFGKFVTRKNSVLERYKSAEVVMKEGDTLVKEIALKIKTMMDEKVRAVERIMDTAANLALSSSEEVDMEFPYINVNNLTQAKTEGDEEEPQVEPIQYKPKQVVESFKDIDKEDYPEDEAPLKEKVTDVIQVTDAEADAAQASQQETHTSPLMDKTRLNLTENCNFFDIPVNMDHSAVHVPSNVFDRSEEVIQGIRWSENLDRIFKDNYKEDPSLSWQYFGSTKGFMRQFPAMIWHQEPVDAFDCRMRSWFLEAASSPKDIVVLVDRSGSMMGMQKEIARHVVNNILDTLGNNDYVNIFTFSNVTKPLIPCFNDTLVQANLANVRELKDSIKKINKIKPGNIANYSDALTVAFQLLENYRIGSRNKSGAGCNQAIMLVTDGAPNGDKYEDLFLEYNWRDLPYIPVRIFAYLIGSEVSDLSEAQLMACGNHGFYFHLNTFAEVREQVLQYIPVMARPMVLWSQPPLPTWSQVYADVTDPKLTDWLWTQRQRRDQRDRFLSYRTHPHRHTTETDKKFVHQQKLHDQDHYGDLQLYTLMTSVSMPVYDKRQNATRIANLLGVAGTDVPLAYIQQLMMPHLLGVNGYAFITTNNGYVTIHPDLRPVFDGILKPAFNRVDIAEVELTDDELEPREFNRSLLEMRKEIVYQRKDKKVLNMKFHLDDMKRVMKGKRYYHYLGIEKTPFTLVVSLPDRYGTYRLQHPIHEDIHRLVLTHKDYLQNFSGTKWRIHPEWIYCRYLSGNVKFNSSEEELLDFLTRMQHEHWKWSHKNTSCDRSLVNALVYDAKSTNFFDTNISTADAEKKGHEFLRRFGVTIAFISTHSGLTRWQDFPQNALPIEENKTRIHFSEVHTKAIDEVWYKRAVDHYFIEEDSFVYSVPFYVGAEPDTVITASHAVFLKGKDNRRTPVAVVGYKFYQSAFASLFKNISNNTCENANYLCYFLDNNAYILLGEDLDETGSWFGDHQPGMMKMLVEERVYESVLIYDYQAVCFPGEEDKSFAIPLMTPLKHLSNLLQWTLGTLFYFLHIVTGNNEYESTSEPTVASNQPPTTQNENEFDRSILIEKTTPTACDKRRWLNELVYHKNTLASPYNKKMRKDKPFIVQRVQNSNLIFLLMHTSAFKLDEEVFETPHPEEIDYNMTLACRTREDDLPRRRYAKCINRHINESAIELCGSSSFTRAPTTFALITLTSLLLHFKF